MSLETGQILTQAIAFLIMFAILRRYAWRPLMAVMDERKEMIQASLESIDAQKEEAQSLLDSYKTKLDSIDLEASAKLQEAVRKGQAVAQEIQDAAHNDAKAIISKAEREVEQAVRKAKTELKNDVVDIAMAAAEKVIKEELDANKQKKLVTDFLDKANFK